MDLINLRMLLEEALSVSVREIQLPGIVDAAVRNESVSSVQVQRVAAQLEQRGYAETTLSVEVELFLRVSNNELLGCIERTDFCVTLNAGENDLRATASTHKDWAMAWERGMEPIKQAALEGMRRDAWNMDTTLAEDSYTFQAAMVLLASELIGPYVDRIATFLGYPLGLVQVMATRLYDAKIWERESGEVHCESWFDPQKGCVNFILDLMVAQGEIIREWSEETKAYAYHPLDIAEVSRYAN
jgi:hypothetical protein